MHLTRVGDSCCDGYDQYAQVSSQVEMMREQEARRAEDAVSLCSWRFSRWIIIRSFAPIDKPANGALEYCPADGIPVTAWIIIGKRDIELRVPRAHRNATANSMPLTSYSRAVSVQ